MASPRPTRCIVAGRYGDPSAASASVAVVAGQLWISAGAEGVFWLAIALTHHGEWLVAQARQDGTAVPIDLRPMP